MKELFLSLLILPMVVFAQQKHPLLNLPIDSSTNKVKYEGVENVSGSQSSLYNKAKIWFADAFENANYVIQTQDKEAGILVGKGSLNHSFEQTFPAEKNEPAYTFTSKHTALFTIKVFAKENRYKYVISDITIRDEVLGVITNLDFDSSLLRKANESDIDGYAYNYTFYPNQRFISLIEELKKSMSQPDEANF